MKGDAKVVEYLNKALRHELTAINQYWLHYRLLDNWGLKDLAKQWRKESIEEMEHADKLVDRIIFLDGFPNMQVLAVVKKQDKPVSAVCHRFEPLPQILRNVRYKTGKPLENAKVRSAIKDAEQKLNGQGRLVIRPSGTEPVIRVMGEGDDKVLIEELVDGIVEALAHVSA